MQRSIVFGLAALVLVGGGCSSDPEPRVAPPTPTASSSSPSAEADRGPVATVRAWIQARNGLLETGDSDEVRALSSRTCRSCMGLIEPVEKIYSKGGRFETEGWSVDKAKVARSRANLAVINAGATFAGGRTFLTADSEGVRYAKEHHILRFKVERRADGWAIAFVGFIS